MSYFSSHEFDSPDLPGSGSLMQPSTLDMLHEARDIAGMPFVINSGYRTKEHNAKVGGVDSSSHTKGYAVDIKCKDSRSRWIIVSSLIAVGFNRIGIASTFIHVDNDPDKPKNVIWKY